MASNQNKKTPVIKKRMTQLIITAGGIISLIVSLRLGLPSGSSQTAPLGLMIPLWFIGLGLYIGYKNSTVSELPKEIRWISAAFMFIALMVVMAIAYIYYIGVHMLRFAP